MKQPPPPCPPQTHPLLVAVKQNENDDSQAKPSSCLSVDNDVIAANCFSHSHTLPFLMLLLERERVLFSKMGKWIG